MLLNLQEVHCVLITSLISAKDASLWTLRGTITPVGKRQSKPIFFGGDAPSSSSQVKYRDAAGAMAAGAKFFFNSPYAYKMKRKYFRE